MDSSCHKTFTSYLALTVLHKNTAKITRESKLRGKSKIVIRIASPARANNNCWLLLQEDNSEAGTEHHCALGKLVWQYASMVTLSFHPCYHRYIFPFLSLLPVPKTVSFTGQELCFIYVCSICPNDSKINGCGPFIFQCLCSDTNKLENPRIWFLVYYSSSWSLAALSVVFTYSRLRMLSPRTAPCLAAEHHRLLCQSARCHCLTA